MSAGSWLASAWVVSEGLASTETMLLLCKCLGLDHEFSGLHVALKITILNGATSLFSILDDFYLYCLYLTRGQHHWAVFCANAVVPELVM